MTAVLLHALLLTIPPGASIPSDSLVPGCWYSLGVCGDRSTAADCARTATRELGGPPFRVCAWGRSVLGSYECRGDFTLNTTIDVCA